MWCHDERAVVAAVRAQVDLVLRGGQRFLRDLVLTRPDLEGGAGVWTAVVLVVDVGVAFHRDGDVLAREQDLDRF